ncbi:hypothetical protein D0866_11423 [Hortaea werneckii]|uniref:Uncharacterized protein n=1 Tax=Hortaea werneckii TaxID=91943 RepID=A0A3M7AAA8_HORWE|nr:hypothetical protein D0866_11423 [Hortaea werneckii]
MSASPANQTPGSSSATPNNAALPTIRRKANTSIFNPKKKPVKRAPQQAQLGTAAGQTPMDGRQALGPNASSRPTNGSATAPNPDEDPSLYSEFPIFVSKSTLARGLHYHAFRLNTDERKQDGKPIEVDPYDETVFTRPVRLHRRLARDKAEGVDASAAASDVDDKEKEQREAKRAERQAEREENKKLIAPTGDAGKKPTKKKPQKKVEDVYYDESNPKHQQRSQLRYAEARPWHLEDFEGKQKWIGSYEEPLSNTNVMFEVTEGGFKMIPVEKWYKMVRADRVATMDMSQVEKIMTAKHKAPRWFMNSHEAADAAKEEALAMKREQLENAKRRQKEEDDGDGPGFMKQEDYRADVDEIDFEFNDEFQDDDEGMIYGEVPDEDTKEIEQRIRKEMRDANLGGTGVKDEDKDWDEEEQAEKRAEEEERKKQKKLRRKLKRKEMRHEYESDTDDENRYEESSESEDSQEEREREEKERKEKEAAQAANGDKSGASTKGSNTPNGRPEKRAAPGGSLKRDADLSEMSGNESSRKKTKLNGASAPGGAARSMSPDTGKRAGHSGYGSGSETETSRAGRPGGHKLKIKHTSPRNSPAPGSPADGSRAASPSGSRAQSPARSPPVQSGPFPTLDEIKAAIPTGGIAIDELVKRFKSRVAGEKTTAFIAMVRQVGKQDPGTKKIVPKD